MHNMPKSEGGIPRRVQAEHIVTVQMPSIEAYVRVITSAELILERARGIVIHCRRWYGTSDELVALDET